MPTEARYRVTTWDTEADDYTPQEGMDVPWDNLTLWQLKAALKELRRMSYGCYYVRDPDGGHSTNDPMVLVERIALDYLNGEV